MFNCVNARLANGYIVLESCEVELDCDGDLVSVGNASLVLKVGKLSWTLMEICVCAWISD